MERLYVGCAIPSTGSVQGLPGIGAPQPCRLKFIGITTDGNEVTNICSYSPISNLDTTVEECDFGPEFDNVVTVEVVVDQSLTIPITTLGFIDDVLHTNYYK